MHVNDMRFRPGVTSGCLPQHRDIVAGPAVSWRGPLLVGGFVEDVPDPADGPDPRTAVGPAQLPAQP